MNEMKLSFLSRLENEAFARTSVVAFLMPLNLTQGSPYGSENDACGSSC